MMLDINILQSIIMKLEIQIYNNKDILPGLNENKYLLNIQIKQSGLWKIIFC